MKRIIDFYKTAQGKSPVEKFILSLNPQEQGKIIAAFEYVEKHNHPPRHRFCKMVNTNDLWEVRVKASGNIFRFLCFFDGSALIIAAHGFQKKTQKTPKQEIGTAEKRKRDYNTRKNGGNK